MKCPVLRLVTMWALVFPNWTRVRFPISLCIHIAWGAGINKGENALLKEGSALTALVLQESGGRGGEGECSTAAYLTCWRHGANSSSFDITSGSKLKIISYTRDENKITPLMNMNVEAIVPPLCHLPTMVFNKFIDLASLLFSSFLLSFFPPLLTFSLPCLVKK